MTREDMEIRRKELRAMLKSYEQQLKEIYSRYTSLFNQSMSLKREFEELETQIAIMDGKLIKCRPGQTGRPGSEPKPRVDPMDALKAALAVMSPEERDAFLQTLLD